MGDFDPLHAFNGKLDLKWAFDNNVADIHKFINDVADKPDDFRERDPAHPTQPYPDANPQQRKADLDLLRKEIIALAAPGGQKYLQPPPPQSILRTGSQLAPAQKIPWEVNTKSERFFATFDLLGVFLSIIGPAPTTTTKPPTAKNFFLPLDVVYAKWCITLVSGSGLTPNKAQVTWTKKDDHHQWFFLGANARGWGKKVAPEWPLRVKQTRHDYMYPILETKWVWGASPSIDKDGAQAGWNYGNCAETYPFLYLLAHGAPAASIYGISLIIPRVKTLTHNWAQYWTADSLEPPCANCAHLVGQYGATPGHFTPWV